jgi:hypothetical protein
MAYAKFEHMTVKQLKHLLQDWPEEDAGGNPTSVFIETGPGVMSPVTCAITQTERIAANGKRKCSDLRLESDAWDPMSPVDPINKPDK